VNFSKLFDSADWSPQLGIAAKGILFHGWLFYIVSDLLIWRPTFTITIDSYSIGIFQKTRIQFLRLYFAAFIPAYGVTIC